VGRGVVLVGMVDVELNVDNDGFRLTGGGGVALG
jgi:hypothetical protein